MLAKHLPLTLQHYVLSLRSNQHLMSKRIKSDTHAIDLCENLKIRFYGDETDYEGDITLIHKLENNCVLSINYYISDNSYSVNHYNTFCAIRCEYRIFRELYKTLKLLNNLQKLQSHVY